MDGRTRHATAILGPELSARLPDVKVLLVGAGGIGCEVCESHNAYVYGSSFLQGAWSHSLAPSATN